MTGYESKKHMAQDKLNKAIEPHTTTFHNLKSDWVMRITADRRIEVNEGVEVTEAAQKVLDALQNLLKLPQRPWVGLTEEETLGFTQHEMSVVKYVNKVLQEKNT